MRTLRALQSSLLVSKLTKNIGNQITTTTTTTATMMLGILEANFLLSNVFNIRLFFVEMIVLVS